MKRNLQLSVSIWKIIPVTTEIIPTSHCTIKGEVENIVYLPPW